LCEVQMIVTDLNQHEAGDFAEFWSKFRCVAVNQTWLTNWAGNVDPEALPHARRNPCSKHERVPCSDLWMRMQIAWDGAVNLCCLDAKGSVTLGRIQNQPIEEIWHGEQMKVLRSGHVRENYTGLCNSCSDWASPEEYEFWYDQEAYRENPNLVWKN
jgi:hypothetical protein